MVQGDLEQRRREAAEYLADCMASNRTREATIDAVLAMKAVGNGTLVLRVPRQSGKPIDGTMVTGGLTFRLTEERELN